MFRALLSLVLTGLLIQGLNAAPVRAAQGNDDAQAVEKVRLKVAKIGTGDKTRVTVRKKDGTKIKGTIAQASADDFTVRDRNTNAATTIPYSDVAKLDDNRGSSLRNVLIVVGVGVATFVVLVGLTVLANKD
jgi:hypothetical protein